VGDDLGDADGDGDDAADEDQVPVGEDGPDDAALERRDLQRVLDGVGGEMEVDPPQRRGERERRCDGDKDGGIEVVCRSFHPRCRVIIAPATWPCAMN
jgi:hypothetical protein